MENSIVRPYPRDCSWVGLTGSIHACFEAYSSNNTSRQRLQFEASTPISYAVVAFFCCIIISHAATIGGGDKSQAAEEHSGL